MKRTVDAKSSSHAGRKPKITSQSTRPKVFRKKNIPKPSITHYEAAVVLSELAAFPRTSENSASSSPHLSQTHLLLPPPVPPSIPFDPSSIHSS
ncbi:hypothetical protein PRIPAC_96919 [Pristionchus pacificus]|uniref:Uncharacterized protein n=1 Tax=Pristionchus pacificus TaxID=54126 RepID=A0A2A6CV09_PRIPA|nr:hypothetical protein PRIPAC_96919 [Pristionchus pacificus]|eukprot:PDM81916.1 hypothetical protein PRIPAC_34070 [Pristionchus pacificus]